MELLHGVQIIQDFGVGLALIAIGLLFFARQAKAPMFYLASGVLFLVIGFAYVSTSMLIFLAMLGLFLTLLVYTFFGGGMSK